MPWDDLTTAQKSFVEKYFSVPKFIGRGKAETKRNDAIREFSRFNVHKQFLLERIAEVTDPRTKKRLETEVDNVEAQLMAAEKPNFDAATTQLGRIHEVTRNVKRQAAVKVKYDDAAQRVRTALSGPALDTQDEITFLWEFVQTKYSAGMKSNDQTALDAADRAIDQLIRAIETGRPDVTGEGRESKKRLRDVKLELEALDTSIGNAFPEGKPPQLTTAFDDVRAKLDAGDRADVAGLPAAATAAETSMQAAKDAANQMSRDFRAWQEELARFEVRVQVMQAHPMASEATKVKPQFDLVLQARDGASSKASGHDYSGAKTDLTPVFAQLDTALQFADDYHNFQAIVDQRRAMTDALPDPATRTYDQVKDAIAAAKDLVPDGEDLRDAGNMSGAWDKLEDVLKEVPKCNELIRHEDKFLKDHPALESWVTDYEDNPKIATLMSTDLALLKDALDDSVDKADAGDISEAAKLVSRFWSHLGVMKAKRKVCLSFIAEKALFKTRYSEIRHIDGRFAVEPFYQQLKEDKLRIDTWEAKKDPAMALQACLARKKDHDRMVARAGHGKTYEDLKSDLDTEIARLEGGAPGGAAAADAIQLTKDAMLDAVSLAQKDSWSDAVKRLRDATKTLRLGTNIATNSAQLDGQVDASKLANIVADFDAAFAMFESIRAGVDRFDSQNWFSVALQAAQARAQGAKAHTTSTPPDAVQAQAEVQGAIDDAKRILSDVNAGMSCSARLTETKDMLKALKKSNTKNCADQEVTQAETHVANAERQVGATPPDFRSAMTELDSAKHQIREGMQVTNHYKDYTKHEARLQSFLDKSLAGGDAAAEFTAEATRMRDLIASARTAFDGRRMQDAFKRLNEGFALRESYREMLRARKEAKSDYKRYVTGAMGAEMTNAGTTALATKVRDLKTKIDQAMTERHFKMAVNLIDDFYFAHKECKTQAQAFDSWTPVKAAAAQALREIADRDDPANGPGHARLVELQDIHTNALEQETLLNYSGAERRLAGFVEACDAAKGLFDLYDRYDLAKAAGTRAVDTLRAAGTVGIEPLFKRIESKLDNAGKLAAAFDFDGAIVLLEELIPECERATVTFNTLQAVGKIADAAGGNVDNADHLKTAIKTASALHTQLTAQPSALFLRDELKAAGDDLATAIAEADRDFAKAKAALDRALTACKTLSTDLGRFDQFTNTHQVAENLMLQLAQHPQSQFGHDDAMEMRMKLRDGMAAVRQDSTKRTAQRDVFETVISDARLLLKLLDDHAAWADAHARTAAKLNELETHDERRLIVAEIKKIRAALLESTTKAEAKTHPDAHKQLDIAEQHIAQAHIELKVQNGTAPTKGEIEALLAGPKGEEALDDVIKRLEPGAQRKVMNVAFEARFGCKLELFASPKKADRGRLDKDLGKKAPNVTRFYEVMCELPPSATLDNDSMLVFSHAGEKAKGSYYDGSRKEVAMREGEVGDTAIYGYGLEQELGKPFDQLHLEEGEPMDFFSWNTLHEVGHAVDDKVGFMKRNGAALAGWVELGGNVKPVAEGIASETRFDAGYLIDYISGGEGSSPPVPPPNGCDPEEWDRRRREARVWVDRMRVGKKPWSSDGIAKAAKLSNGKVYHEAYDGNWVGYDYDARGVGVSGYQFRAPGEWFSELYAAVYSKKLKNSHTHYDTIKNAG